MCGVFSAAATDVLALDTTDVSSASKAASGSSCPAISGFRAKATFGVFFLTNSKPQNRRLEGLSPTGKSFRFVRRRARSGCTVESEAPKASGTVPFSLLWQALLAFPLRQ